MPLRFLAHKLELVYLENINPYLFSFFIFTLTLFLTLKKQFFKYLFTFSWANFNLLSYIFILFTPVTGIYYHLLILGIVITNFNKINMREKFIFFLILLPKSFILFDIEIGSFINPILILFLFICAIKKQIFKLKQLNII
jgi:hypothetical protein